MHRYRFVMTLLCLLAVLSGTPLRQAEAANDLARALAEFVSGNSIDTIDGGVGDDSDATILKAGGTNQSPPATIVAATPDGFRVLLPLVSSPPGADGRRGDERTGALPGGPVRRHAWFQCFLC